MGAALRAAVTYRDAMTRPGFGDEPVVGRHGAPPTGRHADPGRPADGGRGRHAAAEATADDTQATVERALRARPAGERRSPPPVPAPVVTRSDDPPGRWNGFGPGALVLPARANGHGGRHGSPDAVEPERPLVNGYHAPPDLPPPVDDWQVESPTGWSAEPGPPAGTGWHAAEPEPPAGTGWEAGEAGRPAVNGWEAGEAAAPPPTGRQGAPIRADEPLAPVDDWQVDRPTLRPAEPGPPTLDRWGADPELPPGDGWPAEPRPSTVDRSPRDPKPPTRNGRSAESDPPTLDRAADPEPPATGRRPSAPIGWRPAPDPAGELPPPVDDWQVDRPRLRPAEPGRIGELPAPVHDWPADRRSPPGPVHDWPAGRRSPRGPVHDRPADRRSPPPAGVPLNGWHAASPDPLPSRESPRVNGRRQHGPLPPPAAGWRAADPRLPLNGHAGAIVPLGERVVHVFDGDSTQLLKRYVPAQETLQREDREPAPRRPPTLPKHPPRAVVRRRRTRRRLLEWPLLIVFALLSAYLIRAYMVQTFYIPSGSMHETLLEGDRVLVNKVSYHMHDVSRGDVVVFRRPPDFPVEDEDLIKRVVGLPGETVEARGGQIYVDGRPLAEPYVERRCNGTQEFPAVKVPAGDLWVMGDNRCNSSDSRVFGPISEDLLVGRAFVLAWPLARLSWL
jgi:signal peptidase I